MGCSSAKKKGPMPEKAKHLGVKLSTSVKNKEGIALRIRTKWGPSNCYHSKNSRILAVAFPNTLGDGSGWTLYIVSAEAR